MFHWLTRLSIIFSSPLIGGRLSIIFSSPLIGGFSPHTLSLEKNETHRTVRMCCRLPYTPLL